MRILVYTSALALFLSVAAAAQDLGSSNVLFGGKKKEPTATTKKKTGSRPAAKRKSTTAKKSSASAKKSPSTAAKKTSTKKNEAEPAQKPDSKLAASTKAETPKFEIRPAKTDTPPAAKNVVSEEEFEDLIDNGNAARDARDYSAAEAAYKRARAIKPKDYRPSYGLGNLYSDQQRWEEAENAYRTALQLSPSNGFTHIALSYVLTQPISAPNLSDRYDEAEKLARRAIELSPRTALGFDQLGVAMELRGQIGQQTETAYRKALQLDDSFAPAYAHLGRLLRRRGSSRESVEAYEKAIKRATDVGTMVVVAEIMQSEQRYKESESLLRKAVNADPHNPAALIMLGRALMALSKFDEAEWVLKRSLSASQNSFTSNSLLATLYTRQRSYEMAENSLMQALRSVPSYEHRPLAQQFVAVGDGYSSLGKRDLATRVYRQAAKLDPDNESLAGKLAGKR
ncbi:MAG: tetratricopeptide repeat protein [Pyrinomonadaceae bacterium]